MTTTVKVLNEGPQDVKVEVQGRNEHGQFTPVSEHRLRGGEFKTLYVYAEQSLQVIELVGRSVEPA